jgi:hypothetical protein
MVLAFLKLMAALVGKRLWEKSMVLRDSRSVRDSKTLEHA